MKLAGAQAERFSGKPADNIWAALVFGDDEGVVSDTARQLTDAWKIDPADVQTFEDDSIRKNPSGFYDALEARALLGGERAIRVRTRGDKISAVLLRAITDGDTDPERFGARLVILADGLAKRSKLRTGIEVARNAAALHVFSDETGDVETLVKSELARDGLEIEPAALALMSRSLPGHRTLARREIEKVALYGRGLARPISVDDIRQLTAGDVEQALADLVSAALSGQLDTAMTELDKLDATGTSPISVLRAMQRELVRMQDAHALSRSGGEVGMKLRPPVWKSEWAAFQTRLRKWPMKRLTAALSRVYDTEELAKTAGPAAPATLRSLIRNLAIAAR